MISKNIFCFDYLRDLSQTTHKNVNRLKKEKKEERKKKRGAKRKKPT